MRDSGTDRNGARDILGRLADQRGLQRVLASMTTAIGVGASLCRPDGAVLLSAPLGAGDLHEAVTGARERVARLLEQVSGGDEVSVLALPRGGGARLLACPVRVDGIRVGYVVAGPVWGRRPSAAQVAALLEACGLDPAAGPVLAPSATVCSRGTRRAAEGVTALATVVAHACEERADHERSRTTLSTLQRVGEAVSSRLDLRDVLDAVLDNALFFLRAEEGSIMLLDEQGADLRILVARGLSPEIVETVRVPLGEGVSGVVAREGRSRLLQKGVRESLSTLGGVVELKSAMCAPLTARDEVIGVINVKGRSGAGDFSEQDLALLEVIASHAAGAIATARLYDRVSRTAGEMSALFAIGTAINSEFERNQVLQRVLDHATELLGTRKGSIMLLNGDTEELQIEVAYGLDEEIVSSVRLRLGEGIAGRVAQEGKPRLLRKGVAEEGSRSSRRAAETRSALCVPLIVRDRVTGVINVSDRLDGGEFTAEHLELMVMMANQAAIAIENAKLHDELHELFVSSITALANAIDARDPYTRGHSERVAVYAVRIGERMSLRGKDLDFLRYAALLHDVGKINIRDEILNKPGRLTDDEFHIMKKHPEYGAAIMMPVKAFRRIIPFMFYHHEKYCSGGGYPMGLSKDAIPIEARIISVADAYDAMTSHRPYRRALTIDQAVQELLREAGGQFDPRVVEVFLQILEEDPEFARAGLEASMRAEREGWFRSTSSGRFGPRGGLPVSPRPRIPSLG